MNSLIDWRLEFGDMHRYVEERDGGYYLAGARVALDVIVDSLDFMSSLPIGKRVNGG
jgi:hypothetical protein